jgi:hypothetical protein
MAETTDEVRHEADQARERLARDLNRLEYRVETMKDWRTWFRRYPEWFLGTAFVSAALLGYALTPSCK